MSIVEEDIKRVRESTDIIAVISGRLQLKKVGQRWVGLCPFHSEKSPSFSVNATEGLYHCFGCKKSGDAITFVRETEQLDFVGAIEFLASKAGIQLRYTDEGESESRRRQKALMALMERATEWYHERLLTSPDGGAARKYLRERGFDRELVDTYRLGWAPDGWDLMCRALGIKAEDAEAIGLGFVNKANRLQDFFRSRVLFPIADDQGRTVAFGGRKLPGADGPKYQNSRENTLYHKSQTLYGLHWAKADIVQAGQVVVCEGYTDVIGFHRAGVMRAVATCGTALTEDHLRVLKRFTNKIVLAYDADQAGQSAAERVYAWEKSLSLEIGVVDLPTGQDPDQLAQSDPELLGELVNRARPFLAFRVDRVMEELDLSSPEARLRSARPALAMVAEHPDPAVRDAYVQDLAIRVRTDDNVLAEMLREELVNRSRRPNDAGSNGARNDARRSDAHHGSDDDPMWAGLSATRPAGSGDYGGQRGGGQRGGGPGRGGARAGRAVAGPIPAETLALSAVIDDPTQAGWFDPVLFRHPSTHAIYDALCRFPTVGDALVSLEGPARETLTELIAGARIAGDALGAARASDRPEPLQLRHELILLVATSELQQLTRGDIAADELVRYAEVTSWAANHVQNLRHAIGEDDEVAARESGDALLDWLIELSEEQSQRPS